MRERSLILAPLENPAVQTDLVLLCCYNRLCILGPHGAIEMCYYNNYYYYSNQQRRITAKTKLHRMESRHQKRILRLHPETLAKRTVAHDRNV